MLIVASKETEEAPSGRFSRLVPETSNRARELNRPSSSWSSFLSLYLSLSMSRSSMSRSLSTIYEQQVECHLVLGRNVLHVKNRNYLERITRGPQEVSPKSVDHFGSAVPNKMRLWNLSLRIFVEESRFARAGKNGVVRIKQELVRAGGGGQVKGSFRAVGKNATQQHRLFARN